VLLLRLPKRNANGGKYFQSANRPNRIPFSPGASVLCCFHGCQNSVLLRGSLFSKLQLLCRLLTCCVLLLCYHSFLRCLSLSFELIAT
jgi:hypothetical protein